MFRHTSLRTERGVNLIEILIGIIIVMIAAIGTLSYFSSARGGIGRQGNRRAALEVARKRLEQLMAAAEGELPSQNGQLYWCTGGDPCTTWTQSATPLVYLGGVLVEDTAGRQMQISAQMLDDPLAGTDTLDVFELSVKVWYTANTGVDDNFNRVHIRTLRTP